MVSVGFNCSGDVSTFDVAGFRTRILAMFPSAEEARITVTPASVAVDAQLIMPSAAEAASVSATLTGGTVDSLSASLGVSILGVSAPTVSIEHITPRSYSYSYGAGRASYSYDNAPSAPPPSEAIWRPASPTMCDTKTLNYDCPVQSMGGLYAHINSSAQLFVHEHQHHRR